jgi:hypothetical protein
MVLGAAIPLAVQVFGTITAKTAPMVLDFLNERLKTVLEKKQGKGTGEIEALKKEIEELRRQLESKGSVGEGDIRQVEVQIEKAGMVQKQYNLELISDQTHKQWILAQFERLSETISPQNTFKISLWTQEGTSSTSRDINIVPRTGPGGYKIGDKITLFFRSDTDCYLTLFNLGTSGNVTVLFPNRLFQDNYIKAGQTYTLPGEGYPFDYVLSGPAGVERIIAIASAEKIDLMDLDFSRKDRIFYSADRSAAAKDIQIVEKRMMDLPLIMWTKAMCEFTVR